jgi:hypothetical protein
MKFGAPSTPIYNNSCYLKLMLKHVHHYSHPIYNLTLFLDLLDQYIYNKYSKTICFKIITSPTNNYFQILKDNATFHTRLLY